MKWDLAHKETIEDFTREVEMLKEEAEGQGRQILEYFVKEKALREDFEKRYHEEAEKIKEALKKVQDDAREAAELQKAEQQEALKVFNREVESKIKKEAENWRRELLVDIAEREAAGASLTQACSEGRIGKVHDDMQEVAQQRADEEYAKEKALGEEFENRTSEEAKGMKKALTEVQEDAEADAGEGAGMEKDPNAPVCKDCARKDAEVRMANETVEAQIKLEVEKAVAEEKAQWDAAHKETKKSNGMQFTISSFLDESYALTAHLDSTGSTLVRMRTLDETNPYQLWTVDVHFDHLLVIRNVGCGLTLQGPSGGWETLKLGDPSTAGASGMWVLGKDEGECFFQIRALYDVDLCIDACGEKIEDGSEVLIYTAKWEDSKLHSGRGINRKNQMWGFFPRKGTRPVKPL